MFFLLLHNTIKYKGFKGRSHRRHNSYITYFIKLKRTNGKTPSRWKLYSIPKSGKFPTKFFSDVRDYGFSLQYDLSQGLIIEQRASFQGEGESYLIDTNTCLALSLSTAKGKKIMSTSEELILRTQNR